jgi:hypothetical protein
MSNEIKSTVFTPSSEQLQHIHENLFLIEIGGKTTYHRWRDVWDEKLNFKSKVQPHDKMTLRAVKISFPVYHKYGVVNSVNPYAFIYGIDIKSGKTFITQLGYNMEFI